MFVSLICFSLKFLVHTRWLRNRTNTLVDAIVAIYVLNYVYIILVSFFVFEGNWDRNGRCFCSLSLSKLTLRIVYEKKVNQTVQLTLAVK